MKPFFNSESRLQALRFHAAELVGTPFAAHAMVPGAGIDCVHVNAWVYLKTGFMDRFEPPRYALDSGSHTKDSQLLQWLDANPSFARLPVGERLQAGDTVCFLSKMAISPHHVGLMLDDHQVLHCVLVSPKKTIISDIDRESLYRRRIVASYRPMEGN